ncbi:MAG: DUF4159 domain-containing protein [Candidatus Eisenbacteria bacterium]
MPRPPCHRPTSLRAVALGTLLVALGAGASGHMGAALAAGALPRSTFTVARLKYGGGGDWYGNQSSLKNLLAGLRERAGVPIGAGDAPIVTPTDEALFNHPMVFMSGHGNVKFSPAEVERLRRWLTAGGFLWCDDDYGIGDSFRRELKRVLPDAALVELPWSHPVFHQLYSFPRGVPKIHEHDGGPAKAFGAYHDGRLAVLFTFDTDIGDGLEDAGVHADTPAKREDALRMAINVALFALSQ